MLLLSFPKAMAMNTQLMVTVQMMNMLNSVAMSVKAGTLQVAHSIMAVVGLWCPRVPVPAQTPGP